MKLISVISVCAVLLFVTVAVSGQGRVPQFRDYPVQNIFSGKNVAPKLDQEGRMFRTRLRAAARAKRDFSGEYVLATWGCGTSCLTGAAVNVRTGVVVFLPFSICCWSYDPEVKPIDYRLNSRLIIFTGARNESETDGAEDRHYYQLRNGQFRFIKTIKGAKAQN